MYRIEGAIELEVSDKLATATLLERFRLLPQTEYHEVCPNRRICGFGESWLTIAKELGVGVGTAHRIAQKLSANVTL
jgi:hypothetical protein